MDDARPWRHDAQVAERRLGPAEELVALAVAVVLAFDVEGERALRPEPVHLDGMIDHEIGGDERVDRGSGRRRGRPSRRASRRDRRPPGTPVKSWRSTRDGMNGISASAGDPRPPRDEGLHVVGRDDAAARVAKQIFEQDLDRDRGRSRGRSGPRRHRAGRRPASPGPSGARAPNGSILGNASVLAGSLHSMGGSVPRRAPGCARRRVKAWGDLAGDDPERERDRDRGGHRSGRHRPRPRPARPSTAMATRSMRAITTTRTCTRRPASHRSSASSGRGPSGRPWGSR